MDAEDATIRLKNIKIKDAQKWEVNADTRSRSSSIESLETEQNEVTIQEEVEVTFYRMRLFTSMFPDYFANFDVLYQSLSPTFNRDQVFQTGEGAGRSGSFFFFSHDKKFIIKTIPKDELKVLLQLLPSMKDHY